MLTFSRIVPCVNDSARPFTCDNPVLGTCFLNVARPARLWGWEECGQLETEVSVSTFVMCGYWWVHSPQKLNIRKQNIMFCKSLLSPPPPSLSSSRFRHLGLLCHPTGYVGPSKICFGYIQYFCSNSTLCLTLQIFIILTSIQII